MSLLSQQRGATLVHSYRTVQHKHSSHTCNQNVFPAGPRSRVVITRCIMAIVEVLPPDNKQPRGLGSDGEPAQQKRDQAKTAIGHKVGKYTLNFVVGAEK